MVNTAPSNLSRSVTNPERSLIALAIPPQIKEHHLMRAKQVLAALQGAGLFSKTDYDTFIGSGTTARAVPANFATARVQQPRATTKRSLDTIQARYLPLPGRIYFTQRGEGDLAIALLYVLQEFKRLARSSNRTTKKGHSFSYARSLIVLVNGAPSDPMVVVGKIRNGNLQTTGLKVEIVNIAPHASTVEADDRIMYNIAVAAANAYAPGLTVSYDYITSDTIGMTYSRGTGGPSKPQSGRAYPVIYALPRIVLAIAAGNQGASKTRFTRPGRNKRARAKKARASRKNRDTA